MATPSRPSRTKKQGLQKGNTPSASRERRSDRLLKAVRTASARFVRKAPPPRQLERHEGNPIITPRAGNYWEMKATCNPGAGYADGRRHLLYRASGGDDVSVLGYAASEDGLAFDERPDEPAYIPSGVKKTPKVHEVRPGTPAYRSGGGGNGGCEDPRLTLIGDQLYLTYTAFDGWGSVRIALSSISMDDFLKKRWQWKKPSLISPPGEIHKNWMLFPEKIRGKFAILHSIAPEVMVEYYDSLDYFEKEENVLAGSMRKMEVADPSRWEHLIRGAGPPPLKTKDGWLLFYHAIDRKESWKYKLGAMLLDLDDPAKVLYRSAGPVLAPDFGYENDGIRPGIVYSCGAVIKDGELYVYYGGGDSVTCVAMANLDTFLKELKASGAPRLDAAPQKRSSRTHGAR